MKTLPNLRRVLQSESATRAVLLGAGAIAIGLVFWKLQYSTNAICCGDFDGYYHIKWSRMLWDSLRHGGFLPQFTWLPLTTLDPKNYVDHHLFFHVFQIPFTWFGDLRAGAKLSAALFGSLAVFSCYWLLVRYRIRYPLVWLLALLACSAPFLYRLSMAKAPPFAIIYLIIGIHFLFTKKYWPLVPLSFIFALTYDMFVFLILASFIWTGVIAWTERRFEWRPIAWVLAGTVAGLVINPYFPINLQLFYEHLRIKITASDFTTKVGNEWYPYDSWEFIGNTLLACIAMFVGYVCFDPADRKRSHHALFFLVLATVLMIMTARWRRIAEYWPPFAVMFAAFALHPWLEGTRSALTRLSPDMLNELEGFLDRSQAGATSKDTDLKDLLQTIGVAFTAIVIAVVLFFNILAMTKDIASSARHETYKAGAEWMRANVPAGQRVFNTDWDDFPRLFYYDPTHNYVSGLDPTYLYDRDQKLSELYDSITLGKEEDPGPLIRDRFGARYVFSDNTDHDDFFFNARESGWFEIVYEDRDCTIFHIRDQKQEPEPQEPEMQELNDAQPTPQPRP